MKKFAHAIAVAATLTAGSAMAAESSEWGAWASTDDDALAQILAANHDLDARSNPRLGPEDSAASDAGGLLSSLIGAVLADSGLTLGDLINNVDNAADLLNDALNDLPVNIPADTGALGGVADDISTQVCGLTTAC